MNKFILPRGYLSYSAYSLWKSSKTQYRKRYYDNEPSFQTAETRYGKVIHKEKEDDPNIHGSETRLEATWKDLPLLGYLDSFNEETLYVIDFKTGHRNKDGKVPWDALKVRKHKQLVMYAALVQLKYGKYNPETALIWIETEFIKETREFDGHTLSGVSKKLRCTGEEKTFVRTIKQSEIDRLLEDLLIVAKEIHDDYENYKRQNTI